MTKSKLLTTKLILALILAYYLIEETTGKQNQLELSTAIVRTNKTINNPSSRPFDKTMIASENINMFGRFNKPNLENKRKLVKRDSDLDYDASEESPDDNDDDKDEDDEEVDDS